ncbi:hypothetical protein TrLO_g3494 [Triparma laevis f. longispina]|uniref:Uncharacterized protein n=1 Tax=Triparma laevis f. longispina TaxID=1714387 RepID=A0A9W7AGE7_9STRA|nr:hypothetical protein TrLO_g3494 [Triparma laevis f. longispina]
MIAHECVRVNKHNQMSESPGPASDTAQGAPAQPYLKAKFRIGSCKGPKNFSFSESGALPVTGQCAAVVLCSVE